MAGWTALEPLESSMLQGVAYKADERTLEVLFHNGHTRHYLGVPPDVFEGLRTAPSPGRFFMKHVRHAYDHRSVIGPSARRPHRAA